MAIYVNKGKYTQNLLEKYENYKLIDGTGIQLNDDDVFLGAVSQEMRDGQVAFKKELEANDFARNCRNFFWMKRWRIGV